MTSLADWPCVALPLAELAPRTTMRVGGQAELLLEPTSPEEFQQAYKTCLERGIAPYILGGGANLLVADGVLPGVVIATERLRRVFRPGAGGESEEESLAEMPGEFDMALPSGSMVQDDPARDPRLVVWAGCTLPALLRAARDLGYSGLEGLVGVPGSLGGGVAMNAGGRWGDMWDVVESVRVLDADGEFKDVARADCTPTYRNGGLGEEWVVGAVLKFEPKPRLLIQEAMSDYLRTKNKVQPVTEWSAGCIYKNPPAEDADGRSAGELIERSGAKELSCGDAAVSERHGNFIVNRGKARAADVFELMQTVRTHVLDATGVELEYEVKRWMGDTGEMGAGASRPT